MSDQVLIALIFTGGTVATAALNAVLSLRNGRKTDAVKREVTTGNAQTMAQLADKAETRRIDAVPPGDQTDADRDHLASLHGERE